MATSHCVLTTIIFRRQQYFSPQVKAIFTRQFSKSSQIMSPKKVCIVGSGNWACAIARIVGENTMRHPQLFEPGVNMWVHEEIVQGRKLTEIINEQHENVKYLPGRKLPKNILAISDICQAAIPADILVIAVPHQFIQQSLGPLTGQLKPDANGISLAKGFDLIPTGGTRLISEVLKETLSIPVSVLMGANLADEVADGQFCETTVGCRDTEMGRIYKKLFETPNFRVTVVGDASTVEICGALKNIVACAAGIVEGLQYGDNTKSAVIRIGLMEMVKYATVLGEQEPSLITFFESCGIGDLVTTCYGGRNAQLSKEFVIRGDQSINDLEKELLNGQKLQGPATAAEVHVTLKQKNLEDKFPLFTAVHKIFTRQMTPQEIVDVLRDHPIHSHSEDYVH